MIFARGELKRGDNPNALREIGFKLKKGRNGVVKFAQPCPALDCGACQIYEARPQYCREFDCALLKKVLVGKKTAESALQTAGRARRLAARADRLLRQLGDVDRTTALGLRFRRVNRRLETATLDARSSHAFGDLSVTMHRLNLLLSAEFYPSA